MARAGGLEQAIYWDGAGAPDLQVGGIGRLDLAIWEPLGHKVCGDAVAAAPGNGQRAGAQLLKSHTH